MRKKKEFEFCEVCKINHDQGRKHNYFPAHIKSLSSLFSRMHKKITDIRFSLKNPHQPPRNRLWCVFCDSDIDELGSTFSSGNAIRHLASEDHLKNLKHFLWKYGGGMDRMDSFRITETDLAKWEKRCKGLKNEVASSAVGSCVPPIGMPNDIQPNYAVSNDFDKNNINFRDSSHSNDVTPLLCSTTENYQVYHSESYQAATVPPSLPVAMSGPSAVQCDSSTCNSKAMSAHGGSQHSNFSGHSNSSGNVHASEKWVYKNESKNNGGSSSDGFQNLTQISPWGVEDFKGNVHSGAPPPWFEASDDKNYQAKGIGMDSALPLPKKSGKFCKLNPRRVGAAWAEKRKIELEMEKRGEIAASGSDADWFPNFGRVWQSGTRKESRKEFQKEKQKLPKQEIQCGALINIQPYISKRMRRDANGVSSKDHVEETTSVHELLDLP
ncbi:hypothetical protein Ancab_035594 [Ancistrocladus abbreviatus]